jgi:hypothetical protein
MPNKPIRQVPQDSPGADVKLEYSDEQVEEHDKREKRAAALNKKVEKIAEDENHPTPTAEDVAKATGHARGK